MSKDLGEDSPFFAILNKIILNQNSGFREAKFGKISKKPAFFSPVIVNFTRFYPIFFSLHARISSALFSGLGPLYPF